VFSELFDQAWKVQYGGAEPFWGLFDQNRGLKALTIPTCLAAAEPPVGTMGSNDGGGGSSTGTGTTTAGGGTSTGRPSGALSSSPLSLMVLIGAITMLFAAIGGAIVL
jgi:hypothetical protein